MQSGELVPLEGGDVNFEDAMEDPDYNPPTYTEAIEEVDMTWEGDLLETWEVPAQSSTDHSSDSSPPFKIQCRERHVEPNLMDICKRLLLRLPSFSF